MKAHPSAARLPARCMGCCLFALLLVGLSPLVSAAQTPQPAPTLEEILNHLQDNLWAYQGNVPNFFADEHVVSTMQGLRGSMKTTTDSIFRLVRKESPGDATILNESRQLRLVNRKPVKGGDLQGPSVFSGGFSTALEVVSLDLAHCFDYTLRPATLLHKIPVVIVDFKLSTEGLKDTTCPGPEKQTGRAFVDPGNFRLRRIEMVLPDHIDSNGIRMTWRWNVDFAPVQLDGKEFWLPRTISSVADAYDGSGEWDFKADYSNYHRLTVKSHIITDVTGNPPQ